MQLLDRILTHIVNHLSNTSYHFQYLYYPGGNAIYPQRVVLPIQSKDTGTKDTISRFG